MIRLQQSHHRCGGRGDASSFLGGGDLVANIRTNGGAQSLPPPVRSKEYPSMACEHRTERGKCLLAHHARRAPVVINNCGKGSSSFGFIEHSVESNLSTWKCDGLCHSQGGGQKK